MGTSGMKTVGRSGARVVKRRGGKSRAAAVAGLAGVSAPVLEKAMSGGGPEIQDTSTIDLNEISMEEAALELLAKTLRGVVQVFTNSVEPSFSQPWTKDLPEASTGSGFVTDVKLKLVVTNAHVVQFARTILLRKNVSEACRTTSVVLGLMFVSCIFDREIMCSMKHSC